MKGHFDFLSISEHLHYNYELVKNEMPCRIHGQENKNLLPNANINNDHKCDVPNMKINILIEIRQRLNTTSSFCLPNSLPTTLSSDLNHLIFYHLNIFRKVKPVTLVI